MIGWPLTGVEAGLPHTAGHGVWRVQGDVGRERRSGPGPIRKFVAYATKNGAFRGTIISHGCTAHQNDVKQHFEAGIDRSLQDGIRASKSGSFRAGPNLTLEPLTTACRHGASLSKNCSTALSSVTSSRAACTPLSLAAACLTLSRLRAAIVTEARASANPAAAAKPMRELPPTIRPR
jgi:hypothetical protein